MKKFYKILGYIMLWTLIVGGFWYNMENDNEYDEPDCSTANDRYDNFVMGY